ncbi:MAG TPA: beta-ketoacyl-ACP synthase III [Phycisphaerales bacterium]|jgi:3-oxoacyl-[acyl-carrier-protein] synthase-3|nr:beta-ketoacyl-ACP synthase III [Phycisphaerales bacterium]
MSERDAIGVTIVGTGSALPEGVIDNATLEKLMDTSDEWIVQRTGIRTRHKIDRARGESTHTLAAAALRSALEAAKLSATDLDLVVCATMTPDMSCPPAACLVINRIGASRAGGFDLSGACSGYVYALNVAHDLMKGGNYKTVAVIGADCLTPFMDYSNAGRSTAILFGDGAGAAILKATDDPRQGVLAQTIHAEGKGWKEIYIPSCPQDFPQGVEVDNSKLGRVQMNGAGVFKFAVGTFPGVIQETLDKAGVSAAEVDMYVCHQSNARILQAARERFGLPEDKLYVNIDRVGNTLAASVPLVLDDCVRNGRLKLGTAGGNGELGQKVLFVAFGGGLTWGSSLWQL